MACCLSGTSPLPEPKLTYLNINWTIWNNLQWNFNQNLNIFIRQNVSANVVCKMAVILWQPQCINWLDTANSSPVFLYTTVQIHMVITSIGYFFTMVWFLVMVYHNWPQNCCLFQATLPLGIYQSIYTTIHIMYMATLSHNELTHWGRVTHICIGNLTIIGSDNGLSPGQRQAIIWTNVGILLIEPLGTKFSEILVEIITFSIKKMHLKMLSVNWRPFCLSLNELTMQSQSWQ